MTVILGLGTVVKESMVAMKGIGAEVLSPLKMD